MKIDEIEKCGFDIFKKKFNSNDGSKIFWNTSLLMGKLLSQSQAIKCGNVFEEVVIGITSCNEKVNLIRPLGEKFYYYNNELYLANDLKKIKGRKKGKIDIDILLEYENIIYYREMKLNLALDSEKNPAMIKKINQIASFLKLIYPKKIIDYGILTLWWEKKESMLMSADGKIHIDFFKDWNKRFNLGFTETRWENYCYKLGEQI